MSINDQLWTNRLRFITTITTYSIGSVAVFFTVLFICSLVQVRVMCDNLLTDSHVMIGDGEAADIVMSHFETAKTVEKIKTGNGRISTIGYCRRILV